ncbi:hypothetical protein T492DRAFT_832380 [Pavlovales sp. CCMP2436]|nr:hypothetical protein T492DRAFT_832380 [Pavlovales sp. CCMP2436]
MFSRAANEMPGDSLKFTESVRSTSTIHEKKPAETKIGEKVTEEPATVTVGPLVTSSTTAPVTNETASDPAAPAVVCMKGGVGLRSLESARCSKGGAGLRSPESVRWRSGGSTSGRASEVQLSSVGKAGFAGKSEGGSRQRRGGANRGERATVPGWQGGFCGGGREGARGWSGSPGGDGGACGGVADGAKTRENRKVLGVSEIGNSKTRGGAGNGAACGDVDDGRAGEVGRARASEDGVDEVAGWGRGGAGVESKSLGGSGCGISGEIISRTHT